MSATTPIPEAPSVFERRNVNLQWLRGGAAIAVVVYHASSYAVFEHGDERFQAIFGHEFGIAAVCVFFAISGALLGEIAQRTEPWRFFAHRILRIYPLFILISLLVPILLSGRIAIDMRALSLAPIGTSGNFRLGVEWTLIFEVFLYVALLAIALLGQIRNIERITVVWIALLFLAMPFIDGQMQGTPRPELLLIGFYAINLGFALGILVPGLARRGFFRPSHAFVASWFVLLCASFAPQFNQVFGSLAAAIFVGLTYMHYGSDTGDSDLGPIGRFASRLGDGAFALYLCHVPIQLFVYRTLDLPVAALWVLGIALPILVSLPLGRFDLALYGRLRKRANAASPQTLRRGGVAFVAVWLILGLWFQFVD